MSFEALVSKVENHSGHFRCHQIGNETKIKTVEFCHRASAGLEENQIESLKGSFGHIPDLISFYSKWGSLRLYHDLVSDDSAFYIAPPNEWEELDSYFRDWIDFLDEEEEEMLPDWTNDCLAIGEVPQSGNYLLMPIKGEMSGCIFKFEHDGFEFEKLAGSLGQFLEEILTPDSKRLTDMASHMRFPERDYEIQWWIEEYEDNQGNKVATES